MKKKTNTKYKPVKEAQVESRRGFFKDAALGAGGIALATGIIPSCDGANVSPSDNKAEKGLIKNGTPPDQSDANNWFTPKEFNLTNKIGLRGTGLKSIVGNRSFDNLHFLDVDRNSTGASTGQSANLFAYNGTVPGPTFRLRGSQNLTILFSNSLSGNNGYLAVLQGSRKVMGDTRIPSDTKDWQINSHLYGPHQQHTTNLHTHGLHVSPGIDHQSQEATQYSIHSDNVLLRVIPYQDYVNRVLEGNGPVLLDNEQIATALYNFKLPRPNGTPHYPGTHWYHPHPHGATYDQVASGMAGFLIVEGPVDDYLKNLYSNNDYKELPLLIQRIFEGVPVDGETSTKIKKGGQAKKTVVKPTVNGQSLTVNGVQIPQQQVFANQVIRLRVLNGSVDGQGYVRFMIVKGDPKSGPTQINPLNNLYNDASRCNKNGSSNPPKNASSAAKRWFTDEVSDNRICLNNIAYDGINLFAENGDYRNMPVEWITIGVANRADFLVAVPEDAIAGDTYTIWVQDMVEAVDKNKVGTSASNLKIAQFNVVEREAGSLPVPMKNSDGSLMLDWVYNGTKLVAEEMLMPIGVDEITISDNNETTSAYLPSNATTLDGKPISLSASGNSGKIRARRVMYSGFGHFSVNNSVVGVTENIVTPDGQKATGGAASNLYNAMLIDGKKYGSDTAHDHGWDTAQHKMLVNSAEEWSVYNYSMTSYLKKGGIASDPNDYIYGVPAFKNPGGTGSTLKTTAVHHPFHMHQNPFYVRSIQDYEGNELLPLDDNGNPIPRWQDTVYVPHNGGRVIFRSRFWDYTGKYVNHCHLLQHEDWGMMQAVEVVNGNNNLPNYIPLPAEEASAQNVFPPLSLKQIFTLDVGKAKKVLTEETLKMLCYDPGTTTFFDQNNLTNLNVGTQPGDLLIPIPTDDSPYPQWNNDIMDGQIALLDKGITMC